MDPIYSVKVEGDFQDGKKIVLKADSVVTVKTIIKHPMRLAVDGDTGTDDIEPPNRIERVLARYDDMEVFRSEFKDGVSANPFVAFALRPPRSGTLIVSWQDNKGQSWSVEKEFSIT